MKRHINLKSTLLALFLPLLLSSAVSGQVRISGTVTGAEDGDPIAGVSVMEEGTQNVAITGANGAYAIAVKNAEATLTFSFMGKKPSSVVVGQQAIINVSLEDDATMLDEVVVLGYGGIVKKSDLTGSVSSVRTKDMTESRATSLTSFLSGRVAGVHAVQNGGAPGSGIDIKIRGASSVSASASPLYVVDGIMIENAQEEVAGAARMGDVTFDPMAMINPDDIESMEILKDASATAIYGSRGANGVVLITTKSGTKDGTNILNITADMRIEMLPQKEVNSISGYEYETYRSIKTPFALDPEGILTTDAAQWWNPDETVKRKGIDTDWKDILFHMAYNQNYNLNYRGSSSTTSYSISGGYLTQRGIVGESHNNRLSFSSKLDSNFKKWLRLGLSANGAFTDNSGVISSAQQTLHNSFIQIFTFRPDVARTDSHNDISDPNFGMEFNPLNNLNNITQTTRTRRIQANGYVQITPVKGLNIKSTFGGYTTDAKSKNFYPSWSGVGKNDGGRIQHGIASTTNWLNENTINYNKTFGKDHALALMGGVTFQKTTIDRVTATGTDIAIESLGPESIQFSELPTAPANGLYSYTIMSYLARVNYDYKSKYLLTASIRSDGSSKFAAGNKFSTFPSGAFAWKVSEEPFFRELRFIDLFKIRMSAGMTGNQSIPPVARLWTLARNNYSFNVGDYGGITPTQIMGVFPNQHGNDDLKWETTAQYDAGLDLSFLQGRYSLSFDAYYKRTTDLLIQVPISPLSGYTSMYANIGAVENKGLEMSIYAVPVSKKDFQWNVDFNISVNRNKVLDLGGDEEKPISPGAVVQAHYEDVFYVKKGYPIGAMFGYETDGLYEMGDFEEFYEDGAFITDPTRQKEIYDAGTFTLREGVPVRNGVRPGFIKVLEPQTGEGKTSNGKTYLGSAEPKFFGGITNTFTYKGFDLSVFCQFSYGNKLFNANHALLRGYNNNNLESGYWNNMWSFENQEGKYHHFADGNGRAMTTDLQVEDASYFKVKNIVLGYTFPKRLLGKTGLRSLRVYATAHNMFTFTKYSWYDPEYSSNQPLMAGLDRYPYPMPRTVLFGLNLSF